MSGIVYTLSSTRKVCQAVFSFLDTREMAGTTRVSKGWRQLLRQPALYSTIDLSACSPQILDDNVVLELLSSHSDAVVSLKLKGCTRLSTKTLQYVPSLSSLTALSLEGCGRFVDDRALLALRECESGLKTLILDGCSKLSANGIKQSLFSCAATLTELSLSGIPSIVDGLLSLLGDSCPQLARLRLNGCIHLTDHGVNALVTRRGATLTQLQLAYCGQLTDRGVQSIATHCKKINDLNFYGCVNISDIAMLALAQCTQLQSLDLAMGSLISSESFETMIQGVGLSLQRLNIYDCVALSRDSIKGLSHRRPLSSFLFWCVYFVRFLTSLRLFASPSQ